MLYNMLYLVYGKSYGEFDSLAKWAVNHQVYSDQVRWLIQVPRIYDIFRKNKTIKSFGEFLNNIFTPVMEASINPKAVFRKIRIRKIRRIPYMDTDNFWPAYLGFQNVCFFQKILTLFLQFFLRNSGGAKNAFNLNTEVGITKNNPTQNIRKDIQKL